MSHLVNGAARKEDAKVEKEPSGCHGAGSDCEEHVGPYGLEVILRFTF
jgi:hypothetical protein